MTQFTLSALAEKLGAELVGNGDHLVSAVAAMDKAQSDQITFLSKAKYRPHLATTAAGAVMIREADRSYCNGNALIVADPYVAYAKVAQLFDTTPTAASVGIAASAVIAEDATIGEQVAIGPNVVIETGAVIGDHAVIGAGCFIGKNARIGAYSQLWANVAVYHDVIMGEHCLVQANTVIGADGFGYANEQGRWIKIPQTGAVVIGDHVEIGASTTIDRGAIDNTIIASNVIIDNQVQIGHNVEIGQGSAVAGSTGIAGSVTIGQYCIVGGHVGINGHINICDGVHITGYTMVTRDIEEPGVYSSGIPQLKNRDWRKMAARVMKIEEMHKRIKALESK
ncbi:UDP-3-O-(3-hydroxymyristoyl)glucosamine N-acyltransferase [Vibrio stylophorae]|uniref:UDP-3-O-acylglucosamine N-acyltransferase n=1 Tax=Vibrio stylophorae TaxID=659351 RepID=A0ABN8DT12_9VIBR|nr:UDP-3-O-(3-hydroxymyristoyl)glucosamine N-acyltransferase [Vibrio stylophorae]CAH0534226.1 UDP-3-O-(3-hydroxymyristoyl)glucosamine N-acyltransferase [Vibrio stylophorae]